LELCRGNKIRGRRQLVPELRDVVPDGVPEYEVEEIWIGDFGF
jgi:hypothetical protein